MSTKYFPSPVTPSDSLASLPDTLWTSRRIRHINGIYIRNLTPFPQRDRVTSALQKPVATMRSDGQASDDIDLLLSRRRSRRISTASAGTRESIKSDEAIDGDSTLPRNKSVRTRPRQSSHASGSSPLSSPSTRRARSSSQVSTKSPILSSSFYTGVSIAEPTSRPGFLYRNASQRDLERVVSSRLIETVVMLSHDPVEPPSSPEPKPPPQKEAPGPRFTSPTPTKRRPNGFAPSPPSTRDSSPRPSKVSSSLKSSINNTKMNGHVRSDSSMSTSSSASVSFPSSPTASTSREKSTDSSLSDSPFYISSVHRPSTNPSWIALDPEREFSPWADFRASKFRVSVLGNFSHDGTSTIKGSSKGKESADVSGWRVLAQWEVDLNDLQPLPDDLTSRSDKLPPNTLVFKLSPAGDFYYLPPPPKLAPRPPTPPGHASDGEIDGNATIRRPPAADLARGLTTRQSLRETKKKPGAGLQDLVKLVTLQTCIIDTVASMEDIIAATDALVGESSPLTKRREISQREERIRVLRSNKAQVTTDKDKVSARIAALKDSLRERNTVFGSGRNLLLEDRIQQVALERHIVQQSQALLTVKSSIESQRLILIQDVDFIFPIDAISAGDLLFSILRVPLPVPSNSSDPAPSLSNANLPNFNEETIASALGYTAQVVHLLAVYLTFILPYPITCAGSRSLIKDPISAMHGPRMFPLFAKGVDTYRFEYAVFLLNKDIEMLLAERDQRVLDMRHTLPNLKNLMLTLNTGIDEDTKTIMERKSPRVSAVEVEDL